MRESDFCDVVNVKALGFFNKFENIGMLLYLGIIFFSIFFKCNEVS